MSHLASKHPFRKKPQVTNILYAKIEILIDNGMKKEEIKQEAEKYVESKELVLMSYPPEYIDDVIKDMKIAFMAGAEWRDEK